MNREAWIVFAGLLVVGGLGFGAVSHWRQHQQLAETRTALSLARAGEEERTARLAAAWQDAEVARRATEEALEARELARKQAGEAQRRAEAIEAKMTEITESQQRLEQEMRSALESRDIAVSELQGRLTVTILDRILFDSGDATLRPEGMQILDQVAQVLARYTNRPVQVFGHTDNVPIRLRFPSNWELSTARAVAAVRYLTENAGVEPGRLSAVGCGEHQPIADNSTAEGRARNRRIALVVLPENFVPTDVPIPAETPAPSPDPTLATAPDSSS
jgi:chemotaxis protein MotB